MPPESAIVVTFVIAIFAVFMAVVGWVSIWSNLPDRRPGERLRQTSDEAAAGQLSTAR